MATRKVTLLAVGVLLAVGGGIGAILSGNQLFMGVGTLLIIVGLVGLMPLFDAALGD